VRFMCDDAAPPLMAYAPGTEVIAMGAPLQLRDIAEPPGKGDDVNAIR